MGDLEHISSILKKVMRKLAEGLESEDQDKRYFDNPEDLISEREFESPLGDEIFEWLEKQHKNRRY